MSEFLEMFCPDQCVSGLLDVDLHALKSLGYECLMLDLDNTMLPWKSSELPESTREWVERAKSLDLKLCIVSNTHYPKRLKKIAESLCIPSIDRALKPRKDGFLRAAKILGVEPEKAVVVGDQVLTDILGGNLVGMYTVLVKPMHFYEFIGTKLSRVVEFAILTTLRRKGRLGTK